MTESVKLATALNPVAAQLIKRYQITEEQLTSVKNPRQWTKAQYKEYLATDTWKVKRDAALAYYGRKCYLCGRSGDGVQIDVHHNNYERLGGGEIMSDLIPLCHEHHEMFHEYEDSI